MRKKIQPQKASKFASVLGLFRWQNMKYVHLVVMLTIFDKTDFCKGLLNSRHLRSSTKVSEEDPTVPSASEDSFMNL